MRRRFKFTSGAAEATSHVAQGSCLKHLGRLLVCVLGCFLFAICPPLPLLLAKSTARSLQLASSM